jgi:hypothetical protein
LLVEFYDHNDVPEYGIAVLLVVEKTLEYRKVFFTITIKHHVAVIRRDMRFCKTLITPVYPLETYQ